MRPEKINRDTIDFCEELCNFGVGFSADGARQQFSSPAECPGMIMRGVVVGFSAGGSRQHISSPAECSGMIMRGDWDGVLRRWISTANLDTSRISQNDNEGGGLDLLLVDFHHYLFSLDL